MALKSTTLFRKAAPALHHFGYTTSECAILLAVADKEYGKAHIAVDQALARGEAPNMVDILVSYCTAGAKNLGFGEGMKTSAALLALQKGERDGILDVIRSRITNKVHLRRINAPALQCLVKFAEFLRKKNRRTKRDAKKPKPVPLDFTPYLTPDAVSPDDQTWLERSEEH